MLRFSFFLLMISTSLQAEDFVHRPDKITSQFQIEISERQSNGTLAAAPGSLKPRAVSKLGLALIMHFEREGPLMGMASTSRTTTPLTSAR